MNIPIVTCNPHHPMGSHDFITKILSIEIPKSKNILIISDDFTRPNTQAHRILLNHAIAQAGADHVSVVFANGMHRAMTYSEMERKFGGAISTVRVYQNNPALRSSPFLVPKDAFYRISISTILPHTFTGYSGGPKLIVPGLSFFDHAITFHESKDHGRMIHDRIIEKDIPDHSVNIIVNFLSQEVALFTGPFNDSYYDAIEAAHDYYSVKINKDEEIDVAILVPQFKKHDVLQTMNCINPFMKFNPVREGGIICFDCTDATDGLGTHYLFNAIPGRIVHYDDTDMFKDTAAFRSIAFVSPNVPKFAIQDYFRKTIGHFHTMQDFIDNVRSCGYEKIVRFVGADMMEFI